jgi:hypothetical protein
MLQSQRNQYAITTRNGSTQHLAHLKEPRKFYNTDLADKQADLKLSGNYKTKTCSVHYIKLSVNGTCIECD